MTALIETICTTCDAPLDPARGHGRCAACLFAVAFAEDDAEKFAGHELLGEIARGGMGIVYRARQREPERIVALKTMRGASLDSPEARARFRHEARAMADLEHAAILPVFTFGEQDSIPFFTMKLATGGTLAQRLRDYAGKWREIAELLALLADAVQHAHAHAVLHRDLKPANILFDENDHAYVSDFGIAKLLDSADGTLTHTAAVLGSPHYLAPEIAAHDARAATTASDVWSLGVILYELLAQRRPFEGDSIPAILRAILDTEPLPPRSVGVPLSAKSNAASPPILDEAGTATLLVPPRDLAVIAMKALAKEPARRYATAAAFAEDLRRWLAGRAITARPVSRLERLALWARRNPAPAALLALIAGLLIVGVTGIVVEGRRAETAERSTRERLAHEHVRAGLRMAEDGDTLRGLPHYVEALRLGLGDAARERVARRRFEMTVRQAPRLAQLWLPDEDGDMQFAEETGRVVINAGAETRVWDAATGAAVSPPLHHAGDLLHLWTDARGSRVVTEPHDDKITVWDAATGVALVTLPGEGHVRAVLGGPRLRLAALERQTRTVRCLAALDGAVDATFSHDEEIAWTVVSPDGTRVLAATKHSLLLWDVATRALVVPAVEFGGEPDFGNFDAWGRFAGLRVKHEDGLAVFDLTTGAITARGATKSIGSVRHGWLDGDRWVVLARKLTGSALRDGASDRLLFDAPLGAGTVTADFAAATNVFVLAGENGASQLWNADTAQPLTPRLWGGGRPGRVRLSADGMIFLTSSSEPAVRLWKLPAQGGAAWSLERPTPTLAAWWQGGALCLVGADGRLLLRATAARHSLALDDAATCAAPDATGRFVFLGGTHGARLWNAESGQPAGPLIPCAGAIRDVALSADGRRAAVLLEKETLLCEPATGVVQHTLATAGALHIALGADGARLVTTTKNLVQLWNAATGELVGEPLSEGGKWRDPGAQFDPTGRRLAVWWSWPQNLPGQVRVLDATAGREILPRLEHTTPVIQAAFSATGDLLATGTRDQRLWVWRMSDGRPALAPIPHDDRINGVGFSPDGQLVWSRSSRVLRTWETATGDAAAPLLRHHGPPPPAPRRTASGSVITDDDEELKIAWSADERVVSCDSQGGVNVWDFRPGARPLAEMDALARVLSMHRIEPGGGLVPLTHEELRAAWAAGRH